MRKGVLIVISGFSGAGKGTITKKQFWALAEFKHPTHQISFHTLSALNCLNFKKSEIVYDRRTEE